MKIVSKYNFKYALKITPNKLEKLISLFTEHYSDLSFHATISDGNKIIFENLAELLDYENAKNKKIKDINIFGKLGYNSSALRACIRVNTDIFLAHGNTMEITFSLPDRGSITAFTAKLDDCTKSMQQPLHYCFLSKLGVSFILPLFFALLCFMLATLAYNGENINTNHSFPVWISIFLAVHVIFFIIKCADKLYFRIFPPLTFLWGSEVEFEKTISKLRSNIFWGIIMSTITGLIVSYMTR